VLSIPANASLESAALPSGPVIWTAMPSEPDCAMCRSESAAGTALAHPPLRSTGTMDWIARPSDATVGPVIPGFTTPWTLPNRSISWAAFARSAAVIPDGRS
jgi:hypothetical protein